MIPLSAKSSVSSVPSTSAGASDGSTEAPHAAVATVEAAGMTGSRVRGGVNNLMKTVGAASLGRTAGATRLVKTAGATTLKRGNDAVNLLRLALVRLDASVASAT